MNRYEAEKMRNAAQAFCELREENKRLRDMLAGRDAAREAFDKENAEIFSIVHSHSRQMEESAGFIPEVVPCEWQDDDLEEIIDEAQDADAVEEFFADDAPWLNLKLAVIVIIECVIWTANHFDWLGFFAAISMTIILLLWASYSRVI